MRGHLTIVLGLLLVAPLASAYEDIEVEGGATVRGRVRLEGMSPRIAEREVFKDQQVCGAKVPDESLVLGPEKEVRYAVVTLEGVTRGKRIEEQVYNVIEQHGCRFVPHVLAAQAGQWLLVANGDPIQHFPTGVSLATQSTLFNHELMPEKRARHLLLEPGIFKVNCNVQHAWMDSYLVVAEHPYIAVTDAAGRYELTDVPPGRYALKVWHERLGVMERPIDVQPGIGGAEDFVFRSRADETNAAAAAQPLLDSSGG